MMFNSNNIRHTQKVKINNQFMNRVFDYFRNELGKDFVTVAEVRAVFGISRTEAIGLLKTMAAKFDLYYGKETLCLNRRMAEKLKESERLRF